MRIAFLIPDNRDEFKEYDHPEPIFGPAPNALLTGFSRLIREGNYNDLCLLNNKEDPDRCKVHVLSCSRVNSPAPGTIYDGQIYYHQIPIKPLGYLKTLYRGCILGLRKKLREIAPAIVHGQGTERYCALSAVHSGLPSVVTIHGNMRSVAALKQAKPFSFHWLAARLESWTLPKANGIICLSRYTLQKVTELNRNTWVIPNAIEDRFFSLNAHFDTLKPTPHFNFICLGTICSHKNQNWLIQTLAKLQNRFDFTLHFYGGKEMDAANSDYAQKFDELCRQYPWVQMHGSLPRNELNKAYEEASALLIPSLEDNCPMVVLEAMAAGLPVIGSKIGGIPDLIQDGQTGWLYGSQNEEQFIRLMTQILSHPEELIAKGHAGKKYAQAHFSPIEIARKHLAVYRKILHHP